MSLEIAHAVILLLLSIWTLATARKAARSGGNFSRTPSVVSVAARGRLNKARTLAIVAAVASAVEATALGVAMLVILSDAFVVAVANPGRLRDGGPAALLAMHSVDASNDKLSEVGLACAQTAAYTLFVTALSLASSSPGDNGAVHSDLRRVVVLVRRVLVSAFLLDTLEAYIRIARIISIFAASQVPTTAYILDALAIAAAAVRYLSIGAANIAMMPSDRDFYEQLSSEDPADAEAASAGPPHQQRQPRQQQVASSWRATWNNLRRLFPFLLPRDVWLRSCVAVCGLLLVCGRVVNVVVPLQYKHLVDQLSVVDIDKRGPYYAWGAVLTFCFLRYLQSGVGVISSLQNLAWIPISQFNTREINVQMLRHLHSLSLQFHINRKTGEVLRVMDRGNSSIASLLSSILFNILPVFVDIFIAVIWFVFQFDKLTGGIVFATMVLYIALTVVITEWRTKFRREMNQLDSASRARAVDSLLNFETVKYYNNEGYEVARFEKSILDYQLADWKSNASLIVLNTAQNTVITTGLAAGCLVCVHGVVVGRLTVGDFIMFVTYILQLYQPLNFFGTYYRVIQQNFIDMESMFDLLNENSALVDVPDAIEMTCEDGEIVFENVSFRYDSRQAAVSDISFRVPPKKTTALVGQSGSGKSTLFRLLFRFYDPQSGRILIDGQDISKVTQTSLRRAIGVVPQDTVCFNDTIAYNIGYGDVTKSLDDIKLAAQRAQIHDRIENGFPDGYETRVGERGLRLSGGEKQRVAIARTLLKDPKMFVFTLVEDFPDDGMNRILLDEATSALDNTTEVLIQRSLTELTTRRTTLVIAHRLSTIVDADNIIVMRDGRIVESGTHAELIAAGEARVQAAGGMNYKTDDNEGWAGSYYHMWMRQLEENTTTTANDGADTSKQAPTPVPSVISTRKSGDTAGDEGGVAGRGYGGRGRYH
ncbi:Homocysteine S-methyltransferase 1 [Entophlyctis sp. JEL0112]|nr:Homocysteine S-methyltransferase 1 [Entophlyctis sp. JEL0112]